MNNYTQSYVSNRISKISDYGITDQLYDPLRATITRASKSPYRSSSKNKPVHSRISHTIHELTPQKADQMKKTTFIPVDKKLVPTNHVYKVRGKKFQAINIQEREFQPLTAEQMQYIIQQGRLNQQSQTVYEFQDEAIYYNMTPSSKITPNYPIYGGQFQQSQYFLPQPPKQIKTEPSMQILPNKIDKKNINSIEVNNLNSIEAQMQKNNSPIYSFNPSYSSFSRSNSQNNLNTLPMNQPYQIQIISQNPRKPSQNIGRGSHVSSSPLSVSKYSFKDNIDRRPVSKPKSQYKYNLFSAIDQTVNSGCKGCGKNEVIAKAPSKKIK